MNGNRTQKTYAFFWLKLIEFIIWYHVSAHMCILLIVYHQLIQPMDGLFFFLLPVYPPILISLFNPKENEKRPRRKVRVANCVCYRRSFFFFGCTCIITKKRDLNEDFLKYDHSIPMFKYRTKLEER